MPFVSVREHFNVYNMSDVAKATGHDESHFATKVRKGLIEAPSVLIGKRKYYSAEQYDRLVSTLTELARLKSEQARLSRLVAGE